MNKSFRGKLDSGDIDRIRLSTNNGLTGYRIVKLSLLPVNIGDVNSEHIIQVFTTDPVTASGAIDFTNPMLLAAGAVNNEGSTSRYNPDPVVIFDNMVFNQDIFISHIDNITQDPTQSVNYYIELEQIKLDLNEATVATLKDMRGRE